MSSEHHIRLTELRARLQQDLERGADAAAPVELEQNRVGRLSRMDAMQQQAMQKASQASLRRRVVQIDLALRALAQGDYGFCDECGLEISAARLQVAPESLLCVRCQQDAEST